MNEPRSWKTAARRGTAMLLSVALLIGFLGLGMATNGKLPKFATLFGGAESVAPPDWCDTHSVPESICVECGKLVRPRSPERGWCATHGVHECVLCNPELSQQTGPQTNLEELRALAARSLAFSPRVENNTRCKLHGRSLQLAGADIERALSIGTAAVTRTGIADTLSVPGEIVAEPNRIARVNARFSGTIWRVEKKLGDSVKSSEVLALIDAVEVGKAKADFQQAVAQEDSKRIVYDNLKAAGDGVAVKVLEDAAAALEAARLATMTAEQVLANLGLPITAAEVKGLAPAAIAERMRFLGLPYELAFALKTQTNSNNLLPVLAPQSGTIAASTCVVGERAEPGHSLFTILDSQKVTAVLSVKLEDAIRVKAGMPVTITSKDSKAVTGTMAWISPAVNEATRTVTARVTLDNAAGHLRVNTPVTAAITLRTEAAAIVVPSSAVHWEGDCHVVFVRDKDYETSATKVYHVRKVRPAGEHVGLAGPVTEIAAGLLPGEWVATANSGIFRSELLKNDLGEG